MISALLEALELFALVGLLVASYYITGWAWVAILLNILIHNWASALAVADQLSLPVARLLIGTVASTVLAWVIAQGLNFLWPSPSKHASWTGHGKVLLFPCEVTHHRTFPQKHSFSYSYLVAGIPVGWEGLAGGLVSCGRSAPSVSWFWPWLYLSLDRGWYRIDPADYLERGGGQLGLRDKLNQYLAKQGHNPAKYPHVYLVTAGKFLGYHFNPISFWYLYTSDKTLGAMILEVNNTFDERRIYFLDSEAAAVPPQIQKADPSCQRERHDPQSRFRPSNSWAKDFHVSPFNSRKGSYAFSAVDPFIPRPDGANLIDNVVTLKSSKSHVKLVARIVSNKPAIDPAALTLWQKLGFLVSWWWVGFATFPRIVKEAGVLFFRRGLHVWYRPEPLKDSIGRNATPSERHLELHFRRYLRYVVDQSTEPIALKYIPSGAEGAAEELMLSARALDEPSGVEEVEFKILTPVFYTRFVYYAHDLEALFCELRESCTIWVSRPDLLPKIFLTKALEPLKTANYTEYGFFRAIQLLRRRPEPIKRPMTSETPNSKAYQRQEVAVDIRTFRMSRLDSYVIRHEDSQDKAIYRQTVLKLFLADRIALGSVVLLGIQALAVQVLFAWRLTAVLTGLISMAGSRQGV